MMWSASDDEESVFNTCVLLSNTVNCLPSLVFIFSLMKQMLVLNAYCVLAPNGTIMEKTQETLYLGASILAGQKDTQQVRRCQ